MYWIYLVVFSLMISVSHFVHKGFWIFDEEGVEGLIVFVLGIIGLTLFLWEEKQFRQNFFRRLLLQKESRKIAQDLNEAYSFIGELNRKIDVMRETTLNLSENLDRQGKEAYRSFFEALRIFGKTTAVEIRFLNQKDGRLLEEVKSQKNFRPSLKNEVILENKENFFDATHWFVARSPRAIEGTIACFVLRKENSSHRIEDPEALKALASQALRFFMLKNRVSC
jgi:hypothetical protein